MSLVLRLLCGKAEMLAVLLLQTLFEEGVIIMTPDDWSKFRLTFELLLKHQRRPKERQAY